MSLLLSHTQTSTENLFKEFKTVASGLSDADAAKRLATSGLNRIEGKVTHWWQILWRQFNTPFIALLLAATILSFALGEKTDGCMIVAFIIINAALGFIQEFHSEQSLRLLQRFVVAEARVIRGGKEKMVPSSSLVPGDVIVVEAGDIIAADVRYFECDNLVANETVLTGESVPVEKNAAPLKTEAKENYQATNGGFSGTTIVSGKGVGVVVATGKNTVLGDISKLTVETHHESSFEKGIKKFSTFILRMILVILALLFTVNIILKGHNANIFELLLFSVALAVSVVPEALPVVTTIALSKGAMKLAKHKVVVKRLSAVEDLGSVEVLCTDKTGTITENKLTVHAVWGEPTAVLLGAVASSFLGDRKREPNNSFDLALWNKLSVDQQKVVHGYRKVTEIPFDPVRKRNSVLVHSGQECTLIVRGAPEVVVGLCKDIKKEAHKEINAWIDSEGKQGNRVVAVATKNTALDCTAYHPGDEKDMQLVGIISFVDPIKTTAPAAIADAKRLGVAIKIITGDGREVAETVGRKVGLVHEANQVVTADELEAITSLAERLKVAERANVFARVSPQQKFKIIELLQSKYEVGFLGEGINDAPALKIANVGIVVQGASDIAREAADIVLLQKSLRVIVDGIREGREIFANTVKYIKATLISNFGNFYAIAVASLLIPFLPMLPVQLLLLNLLSDFPMIAIATDTADKTELRRPRSYNVREVVFVAMILGVVSTVFDFIFFALFKNGEPAVLQTMWFVGSVLTELVLIFSIRTRLFFARATRPAFGLTALSMVAFGTAIALPFTSFGQKIFTFVRPGAGQLGIVLAVVASYFVVTEAVKLLYYHHLSNKEAGV